MGGFRAVSWVGVVILLVALIPAYPSEGSSPVSPNVIPCPGIIASSPQTLSTTPPPAPLNPCPGVVVATYLGGQGTDSANDVAVDASGYAYIVGTTNSTDFPTTPDAYDPTYNGNDPTFVDGGDVFVAKVDPWGALVDSTLFGGSGADWGTTIAVDQSGNIYVAGSTASADFPTTPDAYDRALGHRYTDAFVAKFNPTGSLVYSTLLGGSTGGHTDRGISIAVDASGHVYMTGWTFTYDFPITPGAFASEGAAGVYNAGVFVVKLNPEGTALVFSAVIGGSYHDLSRAIALDAEGNVYVAGQTHSRDFPTTTGAIDTIPDSTGFVLEAFVFKLSPDGGDLVYSTFLGGEGINQAFAIVIDLDGNAHVAGGTSSIDFPTTPGAYDRTFNGEEPGIVDAFVLGMSPTGELLYSTFVGGTGSDIAWAIYLDESDSVHVAGYTASDAFPTSPGAFDATYNGFADAFVAKLERDGRGLNYSTFLGGGDEVLYESTAGWSFCQGPCEDLGRSLAVDPTGNTTVVGGTTSPDFPTTENAFDPTYNGQVDAFLIRIELIPEPNRAPVAYFEVVVSPDGDDRVYVDATNSADAEDADGFLEVRWDWEDNGVWDTGWSTTKTASHEYAWGGTYTIRLELRDTGGLVGSMTREIVVNGPLLPPPPTVEVAATPVSGVSPLTVSFASTIGGGVGPFSYLWVFGDGTTSTQPNSVHTFEAPGAYAVTLTVTDAEGRQVTANVDVVVASPAALPPDLQSGGIPLWAAYAVPPAIAPRSGDSSPLASTVAETESPRIACNVWVLDRHHQ